MVGVNGVGKTTTMGKLANRLRGDGHSVMLCAADTFRAAAIEQLEVWGHRAGVEIVKQKPGADPAAVVYDALAAAKARGTEAVIVDTAGRLHTKSNLMAELEKMKRTAAKVVPGAPHEILLVMDATTGQNGLVQAREFTFGCRRHRDRAHQTRRHGQGRHRRRDHARTGFAGALRGRGRKNGRPASFRSAAVRQFPVRLKLLAHAIDLAHSNVRTKTILGSVPWTTRAGCAALSIWRDAEQGWRARTRWSAPCSCASGRIVGEGFHAYEGRKHAEILAIEAAGKKAARRNALYQS